MKLFSKRNSPGSTKTPPPAAVRAALNRVLASADFATSERKARFLTYTVEQTLRGQSEALTAYDIAVNVFDRDERFDPQSDPLVRIGARRVRDALDHYYLTEGADDDVRITIPKGHYIPVFGAAHAPDAVASRWRPHPVAAGAALALAVVLGWHALNSGAALTAALRHPEADLPLRIAIRDMKALDPRAKNAAVDATAGFRLVLCCDERMRIGADNADFALDGEVTADDSGTELWVFVKTATTGKVLWARGYDLDAAASTNLKLYAAVKQELERFSESFR